MANTPKKKRFEEKINGPAFSAFLMKHKTVKIDGVGTFQLIRKKPYEAYNPFYGKRRVVEDSMRITFRPERALKLSLKNEKPTKVAARK